MKKNIPRLGIKPQYCKMSRLETWSLNPLYHEISIGKWFDLPIYKYRKIKYKTTKVPKSGTLLLG